MARILGQPPKAPPGYVPPHDPYDPNNPPLPSPVDGGLAAPIGVDPNVLPPPNDYLDQHLIPPPTKIPPFGPPVPPSYPPLTLGSPPRIPPFGPPVPPVHQDLNDIRRRALTAAILHLHGMLPLPSFFTPPRY